MARYALITQTPDSENRNPGSTLIANGIQYLISKADRDAKFSFVCQDHYIHEEWDVVRHKADYLVFAGGPRINSHPTSTLYCDFDIWDNISQAMDVGVKTMDLFVGATHYLPLRDKKEMIEALMGSPKNEKVLTNYRDMCCVIARDELMGTILTEVIDREIPVAPCASFYAKDFFKIKGAVEKEYHAVVFRKLPGNEWLIPKLCEIADDFQKEDGKPCHFIAHTKADREWIGEKWPLIANSTKVLGDSRKLLEFYAKADRVLSLRLHASIPALSFGARVTNVGIDSGVFAFNVFNEAPSLVFEHLREKPKYLDTTISPLDVDFAREFAKRFKRLL